MTNESEELDTTGPTIQFEPPLLEGELGAPIKQATEAFDFENPQVNPVHLSNTMTKFLYDWGGYNLFANFIGINLRVIVIRGMESAMFNPRIVYESEETVTLEEGSIAHFGLIVKVARPQNIRVRYEDAFGVTHTETFIDISARATLNSIDGLNGYLFYNRADRYQRDKALKHWRRRFKK